MKFASLKNKTIWIINFLYKHGTHTHAIIIIMSEPGEWLYLRLDLSTKQCC